MVVVVDLAVAFIAEICLGIGQMRRAPNSQGGGADGEHK